MIFSLIKIKYNYLILSNFVAISNRIINRFNVLDSKHLFLTFEARFFYLIYYLIFWDVIDKIFVVNVYSKKMNKIADKICIIHTYMIHTIKVIAFSIDNV